MGECILTRKQYVQSTESSSISEINVYGGTAQPNNPSENDIWINTDTEITKYIFCSSEPDNLEESMIWITTSTNSVAEFNILENSDNDIYIYPIRAQQYIDESLVTKSAMRYINNSWVSWENVIFYKTMNDDYGSFVNSNHYTFYGTSGHNRMSVSASVSSDGILTIKFTKYSGSESYYSLYAYLSKAVDLTDINTIEITLNSVNTGHGLVIIRSLKDNPGYDAMTSLTAYSTVTLDVSSLSGTAYIALPIYGSSSTYSIEITKLSMY